MLRTFRAKLLASVITTAIAFVVLIGASALISIRVQRQLDRIETYDIPRVQIGPALERDFEALSRALQDSVAARDPEALDATRAMEQRIFERLDGAKGVIDDEHASKLRGAIQSWYDAAYDVSKRLLADETGEAIVASIAGMQAKQHQAADVLRESTQFDTDELAAAFTRVTHERTRVSNIRLSISAVCMVIVIALSWTLGRGALRSLDELTRGFVRFGEGRLDQPIPVSADEFGVVARHANLMAESLRHTVAELEAFNYSVSHDLRAPLRPLDGFSQALLEDYGAQLDDKAKDYLKRIRAAAQRMSQLIEDMLQLSRLGRAELAVRPVDIAPIAEGIVSELRRNEPSREVEFVSVKEAKTEGDSRLLRIVLENLLRNSWKFSRNVPQARIELGTREQDGHTVFYVRDNGAGFDPKYSSKLFQPFQRLHVPKDFEGTGIGLAIVQRIVRRHNGRVWAESKPGEGATFSFTLQENKAKT